MSNPTESNPSLGPLMPLYNPSTGQTNIAWDVDPTTVATDAEGVTHGKAGISVSNGNANGQSTMANSAPIAIASDQSAVKIKKDFGEQAGLSTTGTAPTNLVPSTDVSVYAWWSLQITTMAVGGVLTFKWSNDGINFYPLTAYRLDSPTGSLSSSTVTASAAGQLWGGPVMFRYLEVVETSWTSGTSTGVLELYTQTPGFIFDIILVQQSGTWTVQPGNTPNTTPWLVNPGANNNAVVAAAAGSITVIKATPGNLACVTITTAGTVATNIYDNASAASGNVLLALPATTTLGQIFQLPGTAKLGITAAGSGAGAPGYTVYFS